MSETKYISSGGLAFFENKDMEKLRKYSLKGWHVKDFKFMGYTLEKGESFNYTYSVDYRTLKKDEKEEYFNFFSSAKWGHVASAGNIHLFRAKSGTLPIYTDHETRVDKYKNLSNSIKKLGIPFILITFLTWVLTIITSGILNSLLFVLATVFSIIAIPTAGTIIATYNNKWKEEEKTTIVNLVKIMPFLFVFIAVMIMLFFEGKSVTINILVSMIIGAIGFPTAIFVVMSLHDKMKSN